MRHGLTLSDEWKNGARVVRARGYLDASTADELDELLQHTFAAGCPRIVLDLSEIDFLSSAGAGVVMVAHKQAEAEGGALAFVEPSENVLAVFKTLGLLSVFRIYRSEADALDAVAG